MTTYCCHADVRGYLLGPAANRRKLFKHPDGRWFTPQEAASKLADLLGQGIEVLPFGKACEGWSHKTGCPGHEDSHG